MDSVTELRVQREYLKILARTDATEAEAIEHLAWMFKKNKQSIEKVVKGLLK